jgi:hypothetical protein
MVNLVFWLSAICFAAQPIVSWQKVIDNGDEDRFHGLDLYNGDVYAGGERYFGESFEYDLCFFVFDSEGSEKQRTFYWERNGRDEWGNDVAVLFSGNVVVAGTYETTGQPGWYTVWFSPTGEFLYYDSTYAEANYSYNATCIAVSLDDTCYVSGWSSKDLKNVRMVKYSPEGTKIWREYFHGPDIGDAVSIALDDSRGSVFALCKSLCLWGGWTKEGDSLDFVNKYSTNAAKGAAIRINSADHVFIAGDVNGSDRDFMLLKYRTDGERLWYTHKAYDPGGEEECRDMALDPISDCYLAGWQVRGSEEDVALVKTDSAGKMLWSWVDTLEGKQEIEAIEVDEEGYIYLAGSHHNGANWDMLVMKIRQPLTISGRVTDSTGKPMEDFPVFLSGDTTVEVLTDTGGYYTIEVYNGGSYTVSPNLPNWTFEPSSRTYSPLAHRMFDQDFENGRWTGVGEDTYIRPSPYWKLISSVGPQIVLKYSGYPQGSHACFAVFDATGRKVDEIKSNTSSGIAAWGKCYGPGVYFIREVSGNLSVTRKVILVR